MKKDEKDKNNQKINPSEQTEVEVIQGIIKKVEKKIEAKWKKILTSEKRKHHKIVKELSDETQRLLNVAEQKIRGLQTKITEQQGMITALLKMVQKLRAIVDTLTAPPLTFGSIIKVSGAKAAIIDSSGRPFMVNIVTNQEVIRTLKPGQEVILNNKMNIIGTSNILERGMISRIKQILGESRAILEGRMDEKIIVNVSAKVKKDGIKAGDTVRWDPVTKIILEKITLDDELQELELEKTPDVTFEQIGGLGPQIEKITQEFLWPVVYREEFELHKCPPIKGGILIGPPGCGKTLIGKALANYMAKLVAKKFGRKDVKGYFSYIGGPELSSKWVGETPRMLRELFRKARKKSADGTPVVLFFDEIDSFLSTRGSGISSDVNDKYVTQFNALIDGMQEMRWVLVIGATNRPDMVDPAVIREGRLELKLEVNRPNKAGAKQIFNIYLKPDVPLHSKYNKRKPEKVIQEMINKAANYIFTKNKEKEFMEVTYRDGSHEILYFSDFISGAMVKSVVDRTKSKSIARKINGGERGITTEDLLLSIQELFYENKHLVDIHALRQEFILRPGKTAVSVKSLIEERIIRQKKGKLKKEKNSGII